MENTFDIETLATISSGKKERVDGEPSISNRLEVCFVAIASSEKPLLRDGSLAYEASSVNNCDFSVSFEQLNNVRNRDVRNVINNYCKIDCSRHEFVKLLIRRSVYMFTQDRRAIIRTSKLKEAGGNLILSDLLRNNSPLEVILTTLYGPRLIVCQHIDFSLFLIANDLKLAET
ncbi:hypothetical protein ALC57_12471 [Trachymyrmex cornetzi]|uniref:Uncharacterized protein n=1 Tax=Trachymyrmex cornetzi TaxID=471704 RepID=A0A195DRI7_9HYME|nr:hypothetical protein ALC57_12471 [Trachymyrmex cornetzi]